MHAGENVKHFDGPGNVQRRFFPRDDARADTWEGRSIRKLKGAHVPDAARCALCIVCQCQKFAREKSVAEIAVKRRSAASLSSLAAELIKDSGVGRIIKLS